MNATEYLLLFAGFLFWLGLMFVPQFRSFLAMLLSPIMGPVLAISSVLAMVIVSFVVSLAGIMISRHYVDTDLQKSLAERTKSLQKDMRTARREELEKRQQTIMRDQMTLYGQSMKSMCAVSLISVPLYSWAYTYVLDSPVMIIGMILLSVVISMLLRTAIDRINKKPVA
jgi:uncharacterized membrane protein (DUF106 family)